MASKLKLLYWYIRDLIMPNQTDSDVLSRQRVLREMIDQAKRGEAYDEASVKCMARVKRRMLLGDKCPDAPIIAKKPDAETVVV